MIKYFCDKCDKEIKKSDIFTLIISKEDFVYSKYHLCDNCRNIVENICDEKEVEKDE